MSTEKTKRARGGPAVVVEIGNEWLKVIQVDRSANGLSLVAADFERIEPTRGIGPEQLARILKKHPVPADAVHGCLPRQLATVRMVDLPSTEPAEIADMVELQVGKLTPYTREEIVSDYKIVGPSRDGYTRVMLIIVQRSVLRNRFSLMEEAGIPLSTISVGTEGILNWVCKTLPGGSSRAGVAVLDMDASFSDFVVVAENRLLFTRSILLGASQLQSEDGARDRLAREVANALQAFAGETAGVQVDRLLLTGAGANMAELDVHLRERLDVVVEKIDCLQIFRKTPRQPELHAAPYDGLSLTPLVGIALDPERLDFHLVPESVRLRKELVGKARALALLGCLAVAALILLSLWGTLRYFMKDAQLKRIRHQVAQAAETVHAVDQKLKLVEVVQARGDRRLALFNVLAALHRAMPVPEQIVMDALEFDQERGRLQVGGTGGASGDVRTLIKTLELSPLFQDVREDGDTTLEANGRYRFRVVCSLENADVG